MMQEEKQLILIKSEEILKIYAELNKREFVSFSAQEKSKEVCDTILASINQTYFGETNYKNAKEKASAYLYFIIKDHPFIDGNKRTGILVFDLFCSLNNLKPIYPFKDMDVLAVFIAESQEKDHVEFIKTLGKILFGQI